MSGFLIAPDMIIEELGPSAAILYGRVWRYCLASRGQCFAKIETLAEQCHLSRRTVSRLLKELVAHGYIEREAEPGAAAVYSITDKYVHGEGSRQNGSGSRHSDSGVETKRHDPQDKMARGSSQNGAHKKRLKIRLQEEDDGRGRPRASGSAPPPQQEEGSGKRDLHFEALAEICGLQTKRLSKGNRMQLGKHSASLRRDGIGPDFIRGCGESWYTLKFDWKPRGEVKPPTVAQAAEWIGQQWKATETRREARQTLESLPRAYLMPGGRGLKPITSLLGRPEFEDVDPSRPETYPASYLEAARELGVPCG